MGLFHGRRVKGAISIFLVIILIPTMLLSAVLIDGARMRSAEAMTQEAADLAASSVLADYNVDLKEDFGFFAINDHENVEKIYKESLAATLMASGLAEDEAYSDRIWELLKSQAGASNPYKGADFLNLYDFKVDQLDVTPMYSLANVQVLESQMVEQAKFRGVYFAVDRLGILGKFAEIQAEAQEQSEASEAMEDKMEVDEKDKAETEIYKMNEDLRTLDQLVTEMMAGENTYLDSLGAWMKQIQIEITESEEELTKAEKALAKDHGKKKKDFLNSVKKAQKQAEDTYDQILNAKEATEAAIEKLQNYQDQYSGSSNETIQGLAQDAGDTIQEYQKYLSRIENILENDILYHFRNDDGMASQMEDTAGDIDTAITRFQDEIEEDDDEEDDDGEDDEEPPEYYFYYVNSETRTTEIEAVLRGSNTKCYEGACDKPIKYLIDAGQGYFYRTLSVEFSEPEDTDTGERLKEFAQNQSGKEGDSGDSTTAEEAERGSVSDEVYAQRPSVTFDPSNEKNPIVQADINYYSEDGKLTASKDLVKGASSSFLLELGEVARDEALIYSYVFGTFKTRLTGNSKFTKNGASSSDKDSFYMPDWRVKYDNGEIDLRFEPKKDHETVLRGEIEYLVYGRQSDAVNENLVYTTILADRLPKNMYAVSGHDNIKTICRKAAKAASALTGYTVPRAVFYWIFITAWAVAESYMDMYYLVSCGYQIPLFKDSKKVLLDEFPSTEDQGFVEHYGKDGIFVTYEDYLLMLLFIKGRKTRDMRVADLVEMNMRQDHSDFRMAQAYTWIKADTDLSIRYLFGGISPFGQEYEKNGYTGRMKFTNTVYQGY